MSESGYTEWCEANGCQHGHCPEDCEKPQPRMFDGSLVCGKCLVKYGKISVMIPCTPEICD
jgi:hypothetical protein